MKDRYYIENTKSTYRSVKSWLLKKGFKETYYGNITPEIGEAYLEKPGKSYKLIYKWIPSPTGRGYISGPMISLEDVSSCYSEILGMPTGY